MKRESFAFGKLLASIVLVALGAYGQPAQAADGTDVFATVDGVEITRDEFELEVYSAARQTFYHGRPPAGDEFVEFRKSVADKMIDRALLLKEARRRDLRPDRERVDAQIAVYEDRYGDTERWQTEGPQMVTALRGRFEEESILETLESSVRSVEAADEATVRAFYEDNPELFTEPGQNRVSVILLGVPASATPEVWQAARGEAQRILERLQEGASFEELAKLHSSDASAADDGDMGYLHIGMLSANAEEAIAALKIGELSEPVQVLEGIAIFRLTAQKPEALRVFEDVRQRAEELWLRDRGEQDWQALVAELRSLSDINVDTNYLLALPEYAQ